MKSREIGKSVEVKKPKILFQISLMRLNDSISSMTRRFFWFLLFSGSFLKREFREIHWNIIEFLKICKVHWNLEAQNAPNHLMIKSLLIKQIYYLGKLRKKITNQHFIRHFYRGAENFCKLKKYIHSWWRKIVEWGTFFKHLNILFNE